MGVSLTPILKSRPVPLKYLYGRSFAVDGNHTLYQFLSVIRKSDGSHLTDHEGHVTSHLEGLAFRTSKLMSQYRMVLVFVFDGAPPALKRKEIERRRSSREKASTQYREALGKHDLRAAFSKAVTSTRLSRSHVEEAKYLLDAMGLPHVQAPSDAESQASFMASRGDVWAVASRDYDSILYGAPRLVRNLGIQATEFLPSKGRLKMLEPEMIAMDDVSGQLGLTRDQLVDLAILVGTDFNQGILGVGPKKALALVRQYGRIESMPETLRSQVQEFADVRAIFLSPDVTRQYSLSYRPIDEQRIMRFLCEERGFSNKRVHTVIDRMKRFHSSRSEDMRLTELF